MFQTFLNPGLDQQAVNHDFNGVVLALVELQVIKFFVQVAQLTVDSSAHVSLLDQFGQFGFELTFAAADKRRHDHDPVFRLELHHALYDLLRRLPADRLAALWTMWNSH